MKKNTLRLSLEKYKQYGMSHFSSSEMAILGMFLTTDYNVFKKFNFIEDWLKNSDLYYISGNLTYSEKKNGMILMGDLYEKKLTVKFSLSIDVFIKFLHDWEMAVKQKPEEIIVTKEDNKISIKINMKSTVKKQIVYRR
ncbi:hypothetical protein KAH94_01670 [bacterium]|nr:hypothetical protein [bacterium]